MENEAKKKIVYDGDSDCAEVAMRGEPTARVALQQISLTNFRCYEHMKLKVDSRSVVLTGPNGAGKSTLLRTIANRLPAASGQISCSVPVVYVGHDDGLSGSISGRQNLKGWAKINGFACPTATIDRALASFATNKFANISTHRLSRGQRRRLAEGRGRLAEPSALVHAVQDAQVGIGLHAARQRPNHLAEGVQRLGHGEALRPLARRTRMRLCRTAHAAREGRA